MRRKSRQSLYVLWLFVCFGLVLWGGGCSDSDSPPSSNTTTDMTSNETNDTNESNDTNDTNETNDTNDTNETNPPHTYVWSRLIESPNAALLSVHGTSARDIYTVGADSGDGPLVLHWDGMNWERLESGLKGDLWWVHAIDDVVFMTGSDAHVVRYQAGQFERMPTPGLGKHTIFGLWAASPEDVYAVGSVAGRNGFIWHYDGTAWREVALPEEIPVNENRDTPPFFKVWGNGADDVCIVGQGGVILRGNAATGFSVVATNRDQTLFTVHFAHEKFYAVGGGVGGVLLVVDDTDIMDQTPVNADLIQGVWATEGGEVWASGARGSIFRKLPEGSFEQQNTVIASDVASLHAIWVDPDGGVWTVGGDVLTADLDAGVLVHGQVKDSESTVPETLTVTYVPEQPLDRCPDDAVNPSPEGSMARRWNEQLLSSIRRDLPRPTVHARNLFHMSAALWDVWAAYDENADGYLVREKVNVMDPQIAREEAMAYAAYRILSHRYGGAVGGEVSRDCYDRFMQTLGFDPSMNDTVGDNPRALGNRIGQLYIETFANDGANEQMNYAAPDDFMPQTPKIVVDNPGSMTDEPLMWQQLVLAEAVTQNGIPEGAGTRDYVGPHWGRVTPFALERRTPDEPYFDVADRAPLVLDEELLDATVEVLRYSAELNIEDGITIDISPGAIGNNPLGTNDGVGHPINPFTGEPYAPNRVLRGDFARLMAEFWADGPTSETPPGHWNTLANDVADTSGFELRLFGQGEPMDRLAWDVHIYLALNGALHDAAISAWELKRIYLTARPITLIRTLGARGQRSNPSGPSYHPEGLPLEPGVIEVITEASAAPGERHAHLARYIGEVAVFSWRGEPGDRQAEIGGIDWVRAVDWVPYQRRTFVTPAFPGFTSGHSTFSRSGAEVLTQLTGSAFFPGGLGGYVLEPGWLTFEFGPTETVYLQWATYYDAADQAGLSRLWGGIHVHHDDFVGRLVGSQVGQLAISRAMTFYNGTADSPE